MRCFVSIVLVLSIGIAHAQVLRIDASDEDPSVLRFDPAFIARNNVKAIRGQAQVKRDGEPMRPRNEHVCYRFEASGRIAYTENAFGRTMASTDTSSVTFSYDMHGHQLEQLRHDMNGFYALRDELDTEGRPVHETYVRMENIAPVDGAFQPGNTTIISEERSCYATINDTAWRRTYLNDRGLPYREQIFSKDRLGYLRSIQDHYLITERRGTIRFRYNEKGHVAERVDHADLRDDHTTKHTWTYDAAGNALTCDTWHDNKQTRHAEFLYEETTMYLKAALTKDLDTGMITIMRYTTEH